MISMRWSYLTTAHQIVFALKLDTLSIEDLFCVTIKARDDFTRYNIKYLDAVNRRKKRRENVFLNFLRTLMGPGVTWLSPSSSFHWLRSFTFPPAIKYLKSLRILVFLSHLQHKEKHTLNQGWISSNKTHQCSLPLRLVALAIMPSCEYPRSAKKKKKFVSSRKILFLTSINTLMVPIVLDDASNSPSSDKSRPCTYPKRRN